MGFRFTSILTLLLCFVGIGSMNAQAPKEQQIPDWAQDLAKRVSIDGYAQGGFTYQHTGGLDDNDQLNKKDYNTFEMKRVFLVVGAPITDRWFAMFMHDFNGGVVHEYWTSYRFTNNKALSAKIGQFKHAYTIENNMSPTELEAIDVCSEGVTYLAGCGTDRLMGTQYGRDLGLEFFGESNDSKFAYKAAIMNGQGINKKDGNNEKDFIGHLEFRPTKELNIVATGQIGRGHAVERSIYNPGIAVGEDYKRNRWSAGLTYKAQDSRLSLRTEYLEGRDKDVTSRGVYATGVLPVSDKVDLVGSYDFFNYNVKEHMDQHKAIFGLQYWFYKRCRVQLQYVYKSASLQDQMIPGGVAKVFTHNANHAIMCQMQIRIK
ncbi:MAG: porin [Bacteroidaceae bacterium]|nr:porin [Bacteroidaceae bacterium]